jgi:class 3 adenylate cyclase
MRAVVFTDSPRRILALPCFRGSGLQELETRPRKDLKKALPSLEMSPLVYVDVGGLSRAEQGRVLALVSASPRVRFCIVDARGQVGDVAAVFHAGAVDYLGKAAVGTRPTPKRRAALQSFARLVGKGYEDSIPSQTVDLQSVQADGWAEIKHGREHSFAFLFLEVDDAEEMKKRYEQENLAAAMATFREFVGRIAAQYGGRPWMWSRFGGLVLFPLHERTPLAALCGLRILLSSIFYDCEQSILPGRLSFRMALSVGTTVYREGDTGRIISDAVNSIFHLGRRYTGAAQFVLTSDAYELVPQPLREFFLPAGTYEGRRIYRLLRPSVGVREAGG